MNRHTGCHRGGKIWSYPVALSYARYDKRSRRGLLLKVEGVRKTSQEVDQLFTFKSSERRQYIARSNHMFQGLCHGENNDDDGEQKK